ncbi:MAG: hypothetical protein ACE5MH_08860 [Terriglobia bacterium]
MSAPRAIDTRTRVPLGSGGAVCYDFCMRRLVLIAALSGTLLLPGCQNMRDWTELFEDINKTLLPIIVLKKGS